MKNTVCHNFDDLGISEIPLYRRFLHIDVTEKDTPFFLYIGIPTILNVNRHESEIRFVHKFFFKESKDFDSSVSLYIQPIRTGSKSSVVSLL